MSCRSLNFSFGPFGRAIALAAGTSASTPNPLGFGIAWRGREGGYDPCRRQTAQKKIKGSRRVHAPLRFPAPPRMGIAGHVPLSEWSRSGSGGSVVPAESRPTRRGEALVGSGDWFPARGVQRTVVVLWTPEAPVHGTSAGMKNPDRLEERSGFVWMSSTNGLFIGFAAMADTEDLDGDHLVSQ